MSYSGSPMSRRRTSRYEELPSRSKDYSDDYDRSRTSFPGRRGRTRESNGYDSSKYDRDGYGRDDDRRPSFGSRPISTSVTRYTGDDRGRGPNSGATPKPSRVLGVFGLSLRTEERHLYDVMSAYGPLDDIQIVYDSLTGRSRGFAFVYFQNLEDARSARAACARGLELHDRVLRVDYSITSSAHQPTPGVYMGKDKRRNFPDRGRRYGYSDRRPPRSAPYRRSRSRSRSPPRRRADESPYHRRSRVVSSSRSRSPPPVYSPDSRSRGRPTSRPRSVADRLEHDGSGRFPGAPKDDPEWSDRSVSPR
ncbi:Transformer-2 protein beta [Paragonimus heterotremus]|uniref:Transformer-2 protein beta n=1 Tax=Paragonimus heterotremus TaxID=100268 RepID=A0A8J4SRT7_9TREM|nr:Transformer-2 protein beta [Paragonimus heterotremus]